MQNRFKHSSETLAGQGERAAHEAGVLANRIAFAFFVDGIRRSLGYVPETLKRRSFEVERNIAREAA